MARNDYTKAQRDAFQRERIKQELARGAYKSTPQIEAFLGGRPMPKSKPIGDVFGKLTKQLGKLDKQLTEIIKQSEPQKPKTRTVRGGYLQADTSMSTCFDDLVYSRKDGGVYADFARPTIGTWFYPMSRADAQEWFESDSLGSFFNAFIR